MEEKQIPINPYHDEHKIYVLNNGIKIEIRQYEQEPFEYCINDVTQNIKPFIGFITNKHDKRRIGYGIVAEDNTIIFWPHIGKPGDTAISAYYSCLDKATNFKKFLAFDINELKERTSYFEFGVYEGEMFLAEHCLTFEFSIKIVNEVLLKFIEMMRRCIQWFKWNK